MLLIFTYKYTLISKVKFFLYQSSAMIFANQVYLSLVLFNNWS